MMNMPRQFSFLTGLLPIAAVSAGTDGAMTATTEIDTIRSSGQIYGLRFVLFLGTVTSGGVLTLRFRTSQVSASYDSGDDMHDDIVITDPASNTNVVVEIWNPFYRYVQPYYQRTTQNIAITGGFIEGIFSDGNHANVPYADTSLGEYQMPWPHNMGRATESYTIISRTRPS